MNARVLTLFFHALGIEPNQRQYPSLIPRFRAPRCISFKYLEDGSVLPVVKAQGCVLKAIAFWITALPLPPSPPPASSGYTSTGTSTVL